MYRDPRAGSVVDLAFCHCGPRSTRNGQLLPRCQTGLCTLVDICWKNPEKLQLLATFGPGQSGFPMARVDPKVPSREADPA
jgi:hypothetical protein